MPSLWERVASHAEAGPDRTAVVGAQAASYGELVAAVERTAARLSGRCGRGDVIAVHAPTSLSGLVALLTARRLGAAFLPLDIAAPAGRQEFVLRDAGARVVLRHDPGALDQLGVELLPMEDTVPAVPAETAYLIYTSGSTGRPKGVLVSEDALLSRLDAFAVVPGFSADSSFLALTALSFDISLAELLLPLSTGGRIVLAPPSARLDPQVFGDVVAEYRPDVIQATPSFWRLALAAGWSGAPDATVWSGGEALTATLASRLRPLVGDVWNMYGPTEATIWATAWHVDGPEVSLGGPLPGASCSLVDEDGRIVAGPGHEGEIVLGGAGVAIGYLGADAAQQARFTSLPGLDGRVYRTGDRGRYRADGSLEFLGRNDAQVKFRGHRLELGEVEAVLEEHPEVRQAVVLLREAHDPARAHLAAVIAADDTVVERRLRRWLAERLPQAAVPKRITVRPSLPQTTAGKVDRAALRVDEQG